MALLLVVKRLCPCLDRNVVQLIIRHLVDEDPFRVLRDYDRRHAEKGPW